MKNFIKNICYTILSLLRIVLHFRKPDKFNQLNLNAKFCFVIGNGPSLQDDLKRIKNLNLITHAWCVNSFAETEFYEKIQPVHYVFADPSYWQVMVSDRISEFREKLFRAIIDRTTWPLTIYIPYEANDYFEKKFIKSKYINLLTYNSVPVSGFPIIVRQLYKFGLGMPLPQNVLISALFLALISGYKKIVLLGADHSWHQTLELDAYNRVCLRDKHFYQEDEILMPFYSNIEESRTFTMPQLFSVLSKTFEGYWAISEYARYIGVSIINASSVTFIDAFRRSRHSNLEDLVVCSDTATSEVDLY